MTLSALQRTGRHFFFQAESILGMIIERLRQRCLRKIIVKQKCITLRHIGRCQYNRSFVKRILYVSETAQFNDSAVTVFELFRQFLRHLHITEFQHFRLYLNAPAKHFIKKALNKYRRILQYAWCCNKGTFSLNSFQMSILHHPQHCRTHCGTTDTKLFTKLHFFRNFITDRPFSRMNLVHDIFFNL